MNKKMLFVYNPNAGKCKIKDQLSDIIDNFTNKFTEVIVSPTKKRGDATERVIARENDDDCELIACSGGDGTLHEVVNGMMRRTKRVPILYIPTGSTNDFGKSLGIPKDMVEASSYVSDGKCFPCDVASFNSKFFVYTACFGIFTKTSYATPQYLKNALGHFAYVLNGASELTRIPKYSMTVEFNDQVVTGDFIFGSVTSTSSIGGSEIITPKNVDFDDGLYEMILIKAGNIIDYTIIINNLLSGNYNSDKVIYAKVNHVRFISNEEVPWCVDGEFGGEENIVDVTVLKQDVKFMLPQQQYNESLIQIADNR